MDTPRRTPHWLVEEDDAQEGRVGYAHKVFRHMSFHDLIDLLTFGQLSFVETPSTRRDALSNGLLARTDGMRRIEASQSWFLLPDDGVADWRELDPSRPHVCVVSSVGGLMCALQPADAQVRVEQADHSVDAPLCVTVCVARHAMDALGARRLRLHVNLGALLEEVVVSSAAPERFLELVSRLVQTNTPAAVVRARHVDSVAAPHGSASVVLRRRVAMAG